MIFGSCVSRDILNFAEEKTLGLADYYARSSLASLGTAPYSLDEKYLAQIKSDFQRRMVTRDLGKDFLKEAIDRKDFDFILLDLIDERFDLYEIEPGSIVTVSSEFLSTRLLGSKDRATGRWIASGSERHRALWLRGIKRLFKTLEDNGLADRVIVNKVFWADRLEDGTPYPDSDIAKHQSANGLLSWMYAQLEAYVSPARWMTFPDDLLRSTPAHRWGIAPFHYSDAYYKAAVSSIRQLHGDRAHDGATLLDNGAIVAWSGLSAVTAKRTSCIVFRDQELVHTRHYAANGEMQFDTRGRPGHYRVVVLTLTCVGAHPGGPVRRTESAFDIVVG